MPTSVAQVSKCKQPCHRHWFGSLPPEEGVLVSAFVHVRTPSKAFEGAFCGHERHSPLAARDGNISSLRHTLFQ